MITELNSCGITKRYSVYSAFKKRIIKDLIPNKICSENTAILTQIVKILKKVDSPPYGISSFVAVSGLGLCNTLSIADKFEDTEKHEYLLSQFIWRAFFYQAEIPKEILNMPWVVDKNLQKKFFSAQSGYPLIDAAIACLVETGTMLNRHRMICAIFFCKNLIQPWMDGERFFRKYLEDYDKYLNRGNWVWSSQLKFDNQQFVRFMNPDKGINKIKKTEWYIRWRQPEVEPIVDWKESCLRYRDWIKATKNRQ